MNSFRIQSKPYGRGLCIGKTDEICQDCSESSSQCPEAFPMKSQPRALAFWLRGTILVQSSIQFFRARVSLLRFLSTQEMKVSRALALIATRANAEPRYGS
jgi:hypothetical protein